MSSNALYSMYYTVDPENPNEHFSNLNKANLQSKFMVAAAMHSAGAASESQKVKAYVIRNANGNQNKCSVACPDPDCDSNISSQNGQAALIFGLKVHWYATNMHQPGLYTATVALIAESAAEAKRLFARKKEPFTVNPFPGNIENEVKEEDDAEEVEQAPIATQAMPASVQPKTTFFLLEALPQHVGAFATFFGNSQEEVLVAYLKNKMQEGQLEALEEVAGELVKRTKKQVLAQRGVVKNLICPASGCMHRVIQASDLTLHYIVSHKQDDPRFVKLVPLIPLIAPSFTEARKKIQERSDHE